MRLSWRRKVLVLYVRFFHRGQKRKCSNEWYYNHPVRVAEKADRYYPTLGYEIGLCHDLLEDTLCTANKLSTFLKLVGYEDEDIHQIVGGVIDLTDVYTKEAYPQYNRSQRKQREAIRLSQCPTRSQTIKLCDFEDNTADIVKKDPKFAKTYLREKRYALNLMVSGDNKLRDKLIEDTEVYTLLIK